MKKIKQLLLVLLIPIALYNCSGETKLAQTSTKEIVPNYYPNLDLDLATFSASGSWLIVKYKNKAESHRLFVKTLRNRAITRKWMNDWSSDFYEFYLFDGEQEVTYETVRHPNRLELITEKGKAVLSFMDTETLFIHAEGVQIALKPLQNFFWESKPTADQHLLLPKGGRIFQHFKSGKNTTLSFERKAMDDVHSHDIGWIKAKSNTNQTSFAFREEINEKKWEQALPSLDKVLSASQQTIDNWMDKMPQVPEHLTATAQTGWYLLHSFQVSPSDHITRQTLYCSKNSWLTKIWSWDHCFHGLALSMGDLQLGWDQIMVMFDNQLPNGALPEPLSDLMGERGFTKPPVHGWIIKKFIEFHGIEACMPLLEEVYQPLSRFTDYWYNFHDLNNNGMCNYRHGNDGGWDNATAYDQGNPTEGADLAAYLVIQQELLAEIASLLNKPNEAKTWQARADKQLADLLEFGVKDNRFVSPLETTGEAAECASLINYMPLMLGDKLPEEIVNTMINDLKPGGPYMTDYGLATEALNSDKYEQDGYWRGPIWAPPTLQLFDACIQLNELELAREIAVRYTNMIKRDPGFWENYDAINGTGLQAPGVSWTPAAFMYLAHWLALNPEE